MLKVQQQPGNQKKNKRRSPNKKGASPAITNVTRLTVDIVTGKELVSVFFDPSLVVNNEVNRDADWLGLNLFAPAAVMKEENSILTVKLHGGEVFKLQSPVKQVTDNDDEGVDDILKLRDFSEMSLIHTLRVRYYRDEIYTMVGSILISLNPYKPIKHLYDLSTVERYHHNGSNNSSQQQQQANLAPHLYLVAEQSYGSLIASLQTHRNNNNNNNSSNHGNKVLSQSVIISGESGAGKTEACKQIMTYLARITSMDKKTTQPSHSHTLGSPAAGAKLDDAAMGELEQRVLNTNPVLEAFGNAKTLRNDNSSRFGKFIKIHFDGLGQIAGASIEKYLLEKTRVIHQIPGERNFHIFYQLLQCQDPQLLQSLSLQEKSLASFAYTSHYYELANTIDDAADFQRMHSCLADICGGAGSTEKALHLSIYRLLAGLLYLGNVEFEEVHGKEGAAAATMDQQQLTAITAASQGSFTTTTHLLGLVEADFMHGLTKQNMYVNNSVIVKIQTLSQIKEKQASLVKSIYAMLFSWLVDKINQRIGCHSQGGGESIHHHLGYIGLLDIYGFENFENLNSFEQLLINYANERLQSHFNKHIFAMEQTEYEQEGIDWSYITFYDNLPCVELIDGRPQSKSGIFPTLDDVVISSGRQDSNASFLAALNMTWSGSSGATKHANYVAPRFNSDQKFGILHYAGEVFYEIEGFVEKNREATNQDMKELLIKSSNSLLKRMAEESMAVESSSMMLMNGGGGGNGNEAAMSSSKGLSKKPSTAAMGGAGAGAAASRSASGVSKLKEDSVSKQFTTSVRLLFEKLDHTQPHYVRCVKPNPYKRSAYFNGQDTLQQLKYAGMLETIKIRQQGYALRLEHKDFYDKYHHLAPSCHTLHELVTYLSQELSVSTESWQVGTTKLFIRRQLSDKLDRLLALCYASTVRRLQKFWRFILRGKRATTLQASFKRFLTMRKYQRFRGAVLWAQSHRRRMLASRVRAQAIQAIVTMQRTVRGWQGRLIARRRRNPFAKMAYRALMSSLLEMHYQLDAAFEGKDFTLCSKLDGQIAFAKDAVLTNFLSYDDLLPASSSSEGSNGSRSREEVELLLAEATLLLAYCKEKNASAGMVHYEVLVAKLKTMISSIPTIDELEKQLKQHQASLQAAMEKKQFKVCSDLQGQIADIEERKKQLLQDPMMKYRASSVAEMKTKQIDLEYAIGKALDEKQFEKCAELQADLDMIQSLLLTVDLTLPELDMKIDALQAAFIQHRDWRYFPGMAKAQLEMDRLKQQKEKMELALAAQTMISPTKREMQRKAAEESAKPLTRKDLLSKKADLSIQLEKAIEAKNYALCDQLNADIEKLDMQLAVIPTLSSINSKIKENQDKLKELIKSKKFAQCPEIEREIERLNKIKQELRDQEEPAEEDGLDKENKKGNSTANKKKGGKPLAKGAALKLTRPAIASTATSCKETPNSSHTGGGGNRSLGTTGYEGSTAANRRDVDSRPVSKLRLKPPMTASEQLSIYEVACLMASHRVDAILLLDEAGSLAGILTDNDITRRVVSQFVDVREMKVSEVMTRHPKCVHVQESALDALEMMVENRFRHLPVLDDYDQVVGLLDIAKCLYDAISVLEKIQDQAEGSGGGGGQQQGGGKAGGGGEGDEVVELMMTAAMKKMASSRGLKGSAQQEHQLQMMKQLMEQMFGGQVPTLRSICSSHSLSSVRETVNVREASSLMAKHRKGLLVFDGDDELVGIFTPKDILCRVVAANKSPDVTAVLTVMTPHPACVSADLTLLDALKEMHDQKFLHLPVQEDEEAAGGAAGSSKGRVVGLVDVMDLVNHTAGEGGGQGKGWRDFFGGVMTARAAGGSGSGQDGTSQDLSESASEASRSHGGGSSTKRSNVKQPAATTGPQPIRATYVHQPPVQQTPSLPYDPTRQALFTPAPTNGTAAADLFDFKITDQLGHLHKVRSSATSYMALLTVVAEKLALTGHKEEILIKYIDEEKDEIVINSDSTLQDAIHMARQITGSYALKITVSSAPAAIAAEGKAGGSSSSSSGSGGSLWLVGGLVLGVAVIAGVAVIVMKSKQK